MLLLTRYCQPELDNNKRKQAGALLTTQEEEEPNSDCTTAKFKLVQHITYLLLDTVLSPLVATFNRVAAGWNEQWMNTIFRDHYNFHKDINYKFLATRKAKLNNHVKSALCRWISPCGIRTRKESSIKTKERSKYWREKMRPNCNNNIIMLKRKIVPISNSLIVWRIMLIIIIKMCLTMAQWLINFELYYSI